MANWSPLREKLASVDDRIQIAWADLDELVGGLPRSAYDHQAFWSGDRSGWPGFTTTDVRVGRSGLCFLTASVGARWHHRRRILVRVSVVDEDGGAELAAEAAA